MGRGQKIKLQLGRPIRWQEPHSGWPKTVEVRSKKKMEFPQSFNMASAVETLKKRRVTKIPLNLVL